MTHRPSSVQLIANGLFDRAKEILLECAPELHMLGFNERLPASLFQTIGVWSEQLLSAEPWAAFDIEGLPDLFHALNIAMLSCYAYKPEEDQANPPRPGRVHLRFVDTGGGLLVERTRAAAGAISVVIHGAEGEDIVYAAQLELEALLDSISASIARAL